MPYSGQNTLQQQQLMMRSDDQTTSILNVILGACTPVHYPAAVLQQVPHNSVIGGDLEQASAPQLPVIVPFEPAPALEENNHADDGADDQCHGHVEKKRRLSFRQVQALERNFELENKLEPERKMALARELELSPRQVAVWFQNRRSRCRTKQLERDFENLSINHAKLKSDYAALLQAKINLEAEVTRLKAIAAEALTKIAATPSSPLALSRSNDTVSTVAASPIEIVVLSPEPKPEGENINRTMSTDSVVSAIMDAVSPVTDTSNTFLNLMQLNPLPQLPVANSSPEYTLTGPNLDVDYLRDADQNDLVFQTHSLMNLEAMAELGNDPSVFFANDPTDEQQLTPNWPSSWKWTAPA